MNGKILCFVPIFLIGSLFSFNPQSVAVSRLNELALVEEDFPRLPEQEESVGRHEMVSSLQAIVLCASLDDFLEGDGLEAVVGIRFVGIDPPGGWNGLAHYLEGLFLGRPLYSETLVKIQDSIALYYKENHFPLVLVEIPEQEVTSGVLQVIIHPSRLGCVKVEGKKWSDEGHLQEFIQIQSGEMIDERILIKNLNIINRNPFRKVDLLYSPGDEEGTTDLVLLLDERSSWRVYAGAENTGVDTTERQRWFTGINYGNLFNRGHVLSYQCIGAYDVNRFLAQTAQYIAPLPSQHVLNLYGGYSEANVKVSGSSNKMKGQSSQVSGRYLIPFKERRYWTHEAVFGFDFKRTNNTFEFYEVFLRVAAPVNLTQFVFGYYGNYSGVSQRIDLDWEIFGSPGPMIHDEKSRDYQDLRPGAKNRWLYSRLNAVCLQQLPSAFSFSCQIQAQLSTTPLLPSEQLGIGGYNTVRGYTERQLNVDNGLLVTGEIRSPAMRLLTHWNKKIEDRLQFLAFLDYGMGKDIVDVPGEKVYDWILGCGPGLRYTIDPYLTCRFDWGIKLHHAKRFTGGASMAYFSVTTSY